MTGGSASPFRRREETVGPIFSHRLTRWSDLLTIAHMLSRALSIVACAVAVVTTAACGTSDRSSPSGYLGMGGQTGYGGAVNVGRCSGDETMERECSITVKQASGVKSCFTGFQYCDDGYWTECLDPEHDPRVQ